MIGSSATVAATKEIFVTAASKSATVSRMRIALAPTSAKAPVLVSISPKASALALAQTPQIRSVADSLALYNAAPAARRRGLSSFAISDSAENISASLDELQSLAKVGKIASVSYIDSENSIPTVTIAASKLKANKQIIDKLGDAYKTISFKSNYSAYRLVAAKNGDLIVTGGIEKRYLVSGANFLKFADCTVIASSGDKNIDALLNIGTPMWWYGTAGASFDTKKIHPNLNMLSADSSRHSINYSFMSDTDIATLASPVDRVGGIVMTGSQTAAIKSAFEYISSLINITFIDVTGTNAKADISFAQNTQGFSAGYAYSPHGNGDNLTSYLFLAKNVVSNPQGVTNTSYRPGSFGWATLLHEIAHTLGLKHPGNYNAGGGGSSGPFLPSSTDTRRFSIMSYNNPRDAGIVNAAPITGGVTYQSNALNPTTYMNYDIAALQFLYGANTNPSGAAASALSTIQSLTFNDNYIGFQTIWAPGGVTLDASALGSNSLFDLRPGAYSTINKKSSVSDNLPPLVKKNQTYLGENNVCLAYGGTISNVLGGQGADKFYTSRYSAKIDGGSGFDTVYLSGSAKDWVISDDRQSAKWNSDYNVVISMKNIESISYYDSAKTSFLHKF